MAAVALGPLEQPDRNARAHRVRLETRVQVPDHRILFLLAVVAQQALDRLREPAFRGQFGQAEVGQGRQPGKLAMELALGMTLPGPRSRS